VEITTASTDLAETVTDLWVELANSQRRHGSHLLGGENRATVRETVVQRIVTDDILIARHEGRVVGFVMFTLEHGRYEQDITRGLIENIYVQSHARRNGIGSALLAAAEQRLTAAGATVIQLEAMAENDGARKFYAAHGYLPHRIELEKSTENDTP
jgi:ribosomal protein S18 acetylase RimI-like enzyme